MEDNNLQQQRKQFGISIGIFTLVLAGVILLATYIIYKSVWNLEDFALSLVIVFIASIILIFVFIGFYAIKAIQAGTRLLAHGGDILSTTDQGLKPLLDKLAVTMDEINAMMNDVGKMMENVKNFSASISEMGEQVNNLNRHIKEFGETLASKTSKFGAGLKTAFGVVSRGMSKKGGNHEE
jgi:uncharacterized protein YoxC